MAARRSRLLRLVLILSAAAVGGLLCMLAVAFLYSEWWPISTCEDAYLDGAMPACMAPAAPPWVLFTAGLVGGAIFAVVAGQMRRSLRR